MKNVILCWNQLQNKQLKEDKIRLTRDIKELKGQLAIYKQEFRLLGKRPIQAREEEEDELEEAVINEVKKRRRHGCGDGEPPTLKERRAYDMARIGEMLK